MNSYSLQQCGRIKVSESHSKRSNSGNCSSKFTVVFHVNKMICFRLRETDSGNYTCLPSNAEKDSVVVHVLEGLGKVV